MMLRLSIVNVTRELQGTADLKTIQKEAKLNKIKIKFGAGSAGNRGVANRGNLFENNFARFSINDYWVVTISRRTANLIC